MTSSSDRTELAVVGIGVESAGVSTSSGMGVKVGSARPRDIETSSAMASLRDSVSDYDPVES